MVAARNWRAIRFKLLSFGIDNPLALPSYHPILDTAEQVYLENIASDNADADAAERERFMDMLYRPVLGATIHGTVEHDEADGKPLGWRPPPPGFEDDDDDGFDSFAAVAR